MTTAQIILKQLEAAYHNSGLTIDEAKQIAHAIDSLHYTDETEMAQAGMTAYHYIYNDASHLIIDDEGFIYCGEENEIKIL